MPLGNYGRKNANHVFMWTEISTATSLTLRSSYLVILKMTGLKMPLLLPRAGGRI